MSKRNSQPGATFLKDARIERPGEKIGGGFFVFRRGRGSGRIRASEWPFEHPTLGEARAEAQRLAEKHPGQKFDVLAVHASTVVVSVE